MELLPCPFCGTTSDHKDNCYFVLLALRADTPHLHEAWNRRASPASAPELREQVKKLENRLNKDSQEFTILCAKETERVLREQLAALAEQNENMRETLQELSELLPVGVGIAALSLPDPATSILNKEEGEIK